MSAFQRTLVATFDAVAMGVVAYLATGGRWGDPILDLMLWGSAAAAAVAAAIVIVNGPGAIAWAAVGYILFAALLAAGAVQLLLLSLAVALMPVIPRPGGSLLRGVVIAAGVALLLGFTLPTVLL